MSIAIRDDPDERVETVSPEQRDLQLALGVLLRTASKNLSARGSQDISFDETVNKLEYAFSRIRHGLDLVTRNAPGYKEYVNALRRDPKLEMYFKIPVIEYFGPQPPRAS